MDDLQERAQNKSEQKILMSISSERNSLTNIPQETRKLRLALAWKHTSFYSDKKQTTQTNLISFLVNFKH